MAPRTTATRPSALTVRSQAVAFRPPPGQSRARRRSRREHAVEGRDRSIRDRGSLDGVAHAARIGGAHQGPGRYSLHTHERSRRSAAGDPLVRRRRAWSGAPPRDVRAEEVVEVLEIEHVARRLSVATPSVLRVLRIATVSTPACRALLRSTRLLAASRGATLQAWRRTKASTGSGVVAPSAQIVRRASR
jgi:hypothetical protein